MPIAVGFLSGAAPPGPRRRRLLDRLRHRGAAAATSRRSRSTSSTARSTEIQATTGSGSAGERSADPARAARRATDGRGRLRPAALHRRAPAGRARRADDRRDREGGRRARRARAPRADALGRPHAHGRDRDERRARRAPRGRLRDLPADPSRCSRRPPRASAEAVASFERASVEWKLDGIRIQVHRRGDEVRIYTRNLNEITHALPGIVAGRALPRRAAGGVRRRGDLDGRRRPAAFQETVSQIDSEAPPEGIVTFLFDLLHVDGDDLLDTPLAGARRAARSRSRRSSRSQRVLTSDPEEGAARARRGAARGTRGRRRQGRRLALRGRPPRQGVAQGEAGAHLRPRRRSARNGATAAGRAGSRTCTSARATRARASS